jgi:hypothetical protein
MSVDQGQAELTRDPHDRYPHRKKQQRAIGEGSEKKGFGRKDPKEKDSDSMKTALRGKNLTIEELRKAKASDLRKKMDLVEKLRRSKSISQKEKDKILKAMNIDPHQFREHERDEKHD